MLSFHIPSNSSNVYVNHWGRFLLWIVLLLLLLFLLLLLLFFVIIFFGSYYRCYCCCCYITKVKSTHNLEGQALFYNLLSKYIIQVYKMLHLFVSTLQHGAWCAYFILQFQMLSTSCKQNGESTVVLYFAFQIYLPGLRNVALICIHISTWCTYFLLHFQMLFTSCKRNGKST